MTRRQAGTHRSRFTNKTLLKCHTVPEQLQHACHENAHHISLKIPKVLTYVWLLVCPEGAEAEMIQLARRWDSSGAGIYEHRPPITFPDVTPWCPVTNERSWTFTPNFSTAMQLQLLVLLMCSF